MRALIPKPARRLAREWHRRYTLRQAMEQTSHRLATGDLLPDDVATLSYGWGNDGYAADGEFLAVVVRHASQATGPVLECGSGLSTLLLGAATRRNGHPVWSLEHEPDWAHRVQSWVRPDDARKNAIACSPLRTYGLFGSEFTWYDPPLAQMPTHFALVVCDGPPGETRGGRYGLVPIMRDRLAPGCVILLDDAEREAERTTAERWARELDATLEITGDSHAYAILTLPAR